MGTLPHLRLLKNVDPEPFPSLTELVDPPPLGSPVQLTAVLCTMADQLAGLVERDPGMPNGTGRVLRQALGEMCTALDELGTLLAGGDVR